MIVLHAWRGPMEQRVAARLHPDYVAAFVGCWRVFLRPDVARRAAVRGVALGQHGCPARQLA